MYLIFDILPVLHFEYLAFSISIYEYVINDCMLCFRKFLYRSLNFFFKSKFWYNQINFVIDNFLLPLRVKGDSPKTAHLILGL